MENPTEAAIENDVKSNKSDWRERLFEMDLLSPIYISFYSII